MARAWTLASSHQLYGLDMVGLAGSSGKFGYGA